MRYEVTRRRLIYDQACPDCVIGRLVRVDCELTIEDPLREGYGLNTDSLNKPPTKPDPPRHISDTNEMQTCVFCTKCNHKFHSAVLRLDAEIIGDSALEDYKKKLKKWRDEQ